MKQQPSVAHILSLLALLADVGCDWTRTTSPSPQSSSASLTPRPWMREGEKVGGREKDRERSRERRREKDSERFPPRQMTLVPT